MPHVSKHKIDEEVRQELEKHIVSFLSDTTASTRRSLFKEILTRTERLMIAKRLAIVFLLQEEVATHTISRRLRVSSSTVARLEEKVERGEYAEIRKWMGNKKNHAFRKVLVDLLILPFEAQYKSLNQLIGEDIEKYRH